jgi:eukaryotic-like serine/threonine-protein kinase
MGQVYRARDAVLAREVAIKVLHAALATDAGFVDRFRREARAAASLGHPNIVNVHDWGAVDHIYFMVMEFVRGQSVRDVLNAEGFLAPLQAADILLQVLAALDHAHRKGIVHRDIKPENVMLTPDGVAKVADFGLARAYAEGRTTQAGNVTGTVQYLAPEQLQGEPADPRTDLYSVGVVAYELLTGRVPFDGETQMAIAYRHLRERVPRPSARNPDVPPGLDGWVASMTEKDRELRPESAAEARRDLVAEAASLPAAAPVAELVRARPDLLPDGDPHNAPTVTIRRAATRAKRRRGGRWMLGMLVVAALIGTAAWGGWTYLVPHTVTLPSLVGSDLERAQERLIDLGLRVRELPGEYDETMRIPKGDVLRMRPQPGTELEEGAVVSLVPSKGPPPVDVPDLVGKTVEQARTLLQQAGLRLGRSPERYNAKFREGRIFWQSVAFPGQAPRESEIDVRVSKGPEPIPLPSVVGKTQAEAERLLESWVLTVEQKFSDDVDRGYVLAQTPNPKTKLQPGQGVTIVVSLGPKTFAMPNVVGMSKQAAIDSLQALGLRVAVSPLPGSNGTTVAGQLPLAGETVRYGQTVTIYV